MTAPWASSAAAPAGGGDEFAEPGTGSGAKIQDHDGRLVIIWPHAVEEMTTAFGPAKATRADFAVLDGPQAGLEEKNALIFPRVLQGSLSAQLGSGKPVLGRIGKAATAKPGQSPAWVLQPPTDEDKALARRYLSQRVPF